MDPVVHFELPYDDPKRVCGFYQAAFGWNTNALGEEMGNYVLATTTQTDDAGPKRRGAINGGFFRRNPEWPAQHPSVIVAVQDIKDAMSRVSAAGGQVLGDPTEIPGVGKYVSFYDTEGNRLSMLEPIPRNWHAPGASA